MSKRALEILNKMTLKQKLGQLMMAGFEDSFYDEHAKILIEEYKVGNIILFTRNINTIPELIKLNKKIYKEVIANTGLIPFISIDQEGGMVTRIMNGATFCPGNMTISATNNPDNAKVVGTIIGEELKRLGINMNLAPSLDVNNNPLNPIIGVRSYGDNPDIVTEYGKNWIEGVQSAGVLATAKHFPGHGDTTVDSHLGLPTITHSMTRLEKIEIKPFASIASSVKAIMSAHIIFKEMDDVPATLSKNILTGLLRDKLGYNGLIISDCLQMKAIDNLYTTEKGFVMGVKGGLNIGCVCHSLDRQIASLKALEEAINEGFVSMDDINERVLRVIDAKLEIQDIFVNEFLNKDDEELLKYFDNDHQEIVQRITDESLTLVKGKPLQVKGKTVLIGNVPFASTIVEDELDKRNIIDVINKKCNIDTYKVDTNPTNIDEIVEAVKGYDTIIYVTYNMYINSNQKLLALKLEALNKNFYVISSRNPYDYNYLTDIKNISCLYEYTPVSLNTIVKYINGEIECNGKLPIEL